MFRNTYITFLAAAVMLLTWTVTATATQTTIYGTTYGSGTPYLEWDLESGLGFPPPGTPGTYSPPGAGVNDILDFYYTNWTRIEDYGVMPNDQIWYDLNGGATIRAIYTSSNLALGYRRLDTGANIKFQDIGGGGDLNTPGERASFDPNVPFAWWVFSGSNNYYSLQSLNQNNKDQMVAYRVYGRTGNHPDGAGLFNDPTYIIGFEDQWNSDRDYQDLVAEVSKVHPVPEPSTFLFFGTGLLSFGLITRYRRRKKA